MRLYGDSESFLVSTLFTILIFAFFEVDLPWLCDLPTADRHMRFFISCLTKFAIIMIRSDE